MAVFLHVAVTSSIQHCLKVGPQLFLVVVLIILMSPQLCTHARDSSRYQIIAPYNTVNEFYLSGNYTYIAYPAWPICQYPWDNAHVSFSFRTRKPSALLLYMADTSARQDFIALTLQKGLLRVQACLNGKDRINHKFRDPLNLDGRFHTVRVEINNNLGTNLIITIDGYDRKVWPVKDGQNAINKLAEQFYIGGLPRELKEDGSKLVLWTVGYQKPLVGHVRNVTTKDCVKNRERALQHNRVSAAGQNWCLTSNPCKNGGRCMNGDSGAYCDCRGTNHEGDFCERVSAPPVATFDGKGYISLSIRNAVSFGDNELIFMKIKTRIANAFLVTTGHDESTSPVRVIMYLMNGYLHVKTRIDDQYYPRIPEKLRSPLSVNGRLDDNQWHSLNLTWINFKGKPFRYLHVLLTIDGKLVYDKQMKTPGGSKLSARFLLLGGASVWEMDDVKKEIAISHTLNNYTGCIEDAKYIIENDISIELLRPTEHRPFLRAIDSVRLNKCIDHFIEDPVSFRRSGASLRIPEGWSSPKEGNLSLRFRTTEPDGLIFYQRGNGTNGDFLALELRSGDLFLLIDAGSGTRIFNVNSQIKGPRNSSDGMEHTFKLNFFNRSLECSLDGHSTKNNFHLNKENNLDSPFREINLRREIYLGSLPSKGIIPPRELWSAVVRRGFVGCISALTIDDKMVDLVYYANLQPPSNVSTNISLCQRPLDLKCENGAYGANKPSCLNGGKCSKGWNRLICDCSMTNYTGEKCEKPATVLSFDGAQWMRINLPREVQSETEHVQLRFKTTKRNGLLFTSYSRLSSEKDRFELKIEDGYLVVIFNFGQMNKRKKITNPRVNDGHWHLVKIIRQALIVKIMIDGQSVKKGVYYDLKEDTTFLVLKFIFIGGYPPMLSANTDLSKIGGKLLDVSTYNLGHASRYNSKSTNVDDDTKYFVGHMMHFVFNGIDYFELARTKSPPNIEVTADFSNAEEAVREFSMTFKTAQSYLTLPCLQIYNAFKIGFAFKTTQAGGVILYNEGRENTTNKRKDFILIELSSTGILHLVFSVGSGGIRITSKKNNLNDGQWHQVTVERPKDNKNSYANELRLRVDETVNQKEINRDGQSLNFNLNQELYIGGVKEDFYKDTQYDIISKMGFQGCLASLSLNRANKKITNVFSSGVDNPDIIPGCAASGARCTPKSCHFKGHCVQQWTRTRCNCEMTSFIGEFCSNVSSTILFGTPNPGFVKIEYTSRKRNTKRDELAFGIQTYRKSVRFVKVLGESNLLGKGYDYIYVDIRRNGYVQAEFFTGRYHHKVLNHHVKVSDGRYHIVRLIRDGADAVLTVDDKEKPYKNPKRDRATLHFNNMRWIHLGTQRKYKRRPRAVRHTRSYTGIISGFVFNGLPVTDLIVGKTTRPSIRVTTFDNVTILKDFKPRLDNFPPPNPVRVGPDTSKEGYNPMLSTTSELSPSTSDTKSNGIIQANTNCPKQNGLSELCRPVKNDGIIQPNLSITSPSTTTATPVRTDPPGVPGFPQIPKDNDNNQRYPNQEDRQKSSDEPTVSLGETGGTTRQGGDISNQAEDSLNLWLIVAISCGGLVFLVLIICLIYRCRRRDEGSYSVESNQRDFGGDPACKPLRDRTSFMNGTANSEPIVDGVLMGGGVTATPLSNRNGASSSGQFGSGAGSGKKKKGRRKETKEWYV